MKVFAINNNRNSLKTLFIQIVDERIDYDDSAINPSKLISLGIGEISKNVNCSFLSLFSSIN